MTDGNPEIDRFRDPEGRFDREALLSILPYGNAFLFVDEVTLLTTDEITGSYAIPFGRPMLEAHFRGLPVMPAALMTEGVAQVGTLLVRYNLANHTEMDVLAFQIESARFLGPAQPGDEISYSVRLVRLRRGLARLEGEVRVGETRILTTTLQLAVVERQKLAEELKNSSPQ